MNRLTRKVLLLDEDPFGRVFKGSNVKFAATTISQLFYFFQNKFYHLALVMNKATVVHPVVL